MAKGYDYAHDPEGRYGKRCSCCDGDLSGLIIFLIVYPMVDGIILFFTSGAWLIFLLCMSTLFFFIWLDSWAKKHPLPKVRKTRRWVEGILLVLVMLGVVFVLLFHDQIALWMGA